MPYVVHDRVIEGYRPASGFFERGGLKTPEGCIEPPLPRGYLGKGLTSDHDRKQTGTVASFGGILNVQALRTSPCKVTAAF